MRHKSKEKGSRVCTYVCVCVHKDINIPISFVIIFFPSQPSHLCIYLCICSFFLMVGDIRCGGDTVTAEWVWLVNK